MAVLVLCILVNVALAVCFKLYPKYRVNTFTAIILNYWVSATVGCVMLGEIPLLKHPPGSHPWTIYACVLGCIFTAGFYIIGTSVKHVGMTITTAMQKMSLLIPTTYALVWYHEHAGLPKLSGILLCLLAIILVTRKKEAQKIDLRRLTPYLLLPLGALVASGIIEAILYHIRVEGLSTHGDMAFTTYGFSVAAVLGTGILLYRLFAGIHTPTRRDLLGGIVLGVPNFYSIYLILVLLSHGYQGSTLYPLLNILILCASALTGMLLFKEKLSRINLIGLVVALAAISLISLG